MTVHYLFCTQFPKCQGSSSMPPDIPCHWCACHSGLHSPQLFCCCILWHLASGKLLSCRSTSACLLGNVPLCLNSQKIKTYGIQREKSQGFFWGGAQVYHPITIPSTHTRRDKWWETFTLAHQNLQAVVPVNICMAHLSLHREVQFMVLTRKQIHVAHGIWV